jgi:DNA-binding MurR/RpiR family transcriptional regulator
MNDTIVPNLTDGGPEPVLDRLLDRLPEMSPQVRKAAHYVLDNPNEVGLSSIREIAASAQVKPNTLVRMARAVGFAGFEDFRRPFRDSLRNGRESYPDRARWLQAIAKGGRHGRLFGQMAATSFENIEQLFSSTSAAEIKAAADLIVGSRTTYVLGVGAAYAQGGGRPDRGLAHDLRARRRRGLCSGPQLRLSGAHGPRQRGRRAARRQPADR